jgi:hypothetical protein
METVASSQEIMGNILMKEIIVSTQIEFDALPNSFDEYTRILIKNATSKLMVKISRGNSSVVAWGNCVVRIFSGYLKNIVLYGFAVAIVSSTITVNIEKKSEYCHVQIVKYLGWFENNGIEKTPTVTLYKKVSKDFKTQENTKNETLWLTGSTVEHPAWNPNNGECGEGKFHACSRPYFCDEFRNNKGDRYIAISINLEDLYEWKDSPSYPHKISFRRGTILYECDKFERKLN